MNAAAALNAEHTNASMEIASLHESIASRVQVSWLLDAISLMPRTAD